MQRRQWKVENIIVIALIITKEAIERISKIHPSGVQFYVGRVQELDENARVTPGVGDMGDRLYL